MKSEELYSLIEKDILPQCFEIMKTKGESYSGLEDKLGNFKRIAKTLNLSVEQVWYVYFAKHMDALQSYLRGEYKDSEKIQGRIQDLINYLFLLTGILKEQNKI
jgi:hypothetical protein